MTDDPATAGRPWHAMPPADVLAALGVTADGLDPGEARARLARFGANQLPEPPRTSAALRFLRQFHSVLIYFLLAGAVAAALLGHRVDAAMIVIVVVVNAIVGFLQEGRAERALDAIRDMIAPHAIVVRGGTRERIDAREIVPGDLVVLEAGDKVPADLRLIRARTLLANEATLTGESLPAEKSEAAVAADAALGDRRSMLHSGTLVATGQATGIAVETGARTEIGRISALIGEVRSLTTPLLAQVDRFGRLVTYVAIALVAGLYAWGVLVNGEDPVEALMLGVALAVGIVPEGLPAVITVTLAIGVQRMAARHAVVRRLPAVETLGATSVICSDKTGTLTRNEMTVRQVVTAAGEAAVTGEGYAPAGAVEAAAADPARDLLLRAALLCNDARLVEDEETGAWRVLGDPMEGALVALAAKAGLHPETERDAWNRVDEIPFDARHRFMATLHDAPGGGRRLFVKGAPERIVALCVEDAGGGPVDAAAWAARTAGLAARGERVLGFATRPMPAATDRLAFADVEGLAMLGLTGLIDPPRAEAIAAVADCRAAGIAVKMITGDHADTAVAIAGQLALAAAPAALTGAELDALDDAALVDAAERTSVFARTSPQHKLRIVRALQSRGLVVAMTGDGVNDAPSLKQADVGIAMGRKGTEAAKEAAEMVLVDDNFASIAAAVHEGRTVYDNIRKVIGWTLPTNGGEALVIIVAVLLGLALPMLPAHILWINMVTTVTLGLTLAFEPPEPGVMRRPPRRRDAPLLPPLLLWRVCFVSVLFAAGAFASYHAAVAAGRGTPVAHTMVVNTIVVMEIFYLFTVRYAHMTSFSLVGAAGTPPVLAAIAAVVVAQLAFTYLAPLQSALGTAALTIPEGLMILGLGLLLMLVMEAEKIAVRRLGLHEA